MKIPMAYNGAEPYIFVSYSHRDCEQVLPIIARLQKAGYRVWYDDGIDPGTEWSEFIAQRINSCAFFIAAVSPRYLASENCRNELGWAKRRQKDRVLLYLEEAELPDGIAIQHSQIQAIHWYTHADPEDAFQRLCTAHGIAPCCAPVPEVPESASPETEAAEPEAPVSKEEKATKGTVLKAAAAAAAALLLPIGGPVAGPLIAGLAAKKVLDAKKLPTGEAGADTPPEVAGQAAPGSQSEGPQEPSRPRIHSGITESSGPQSADSGVPLGRYASFEIQTRQRQP